VYTQIGRPELNPANIWQVYCKMIQLLTGTGPSRECIDAVDEWEVTESLQDLNRGPDSDIPYPLIEGRELFGGIEQDDGSLYLGGVNDGRGLGTSTHYLSPSIFLK
jgi:hypothetical protein